MAMKTVQIRITPEQLEMIDRQVREGRFQSRSEAIRDYIRKAEFFEALLRFRRLTQEAGLSEEEIFQDDETLRKALYEKLFRSS